MSRFRPYAWTLVIVTVVGVGIRFLSAEAGVTAATPARSGEVKAITLIFGGKDRAPTKWDGSVSIGGGEIVRVAGYHFTPDCRILPGNGWQCGSHLWGDPRPAAHPNERAGPYASLVQPVGITVEFRGGDDAEFTVNTLRELRFRYSDIPETGAIYPIHGAVEVWRTPVIERLGTPEYEDDYPSLAAGADGVIWLAWQAYRDKAENVFLRRYGNGAWGAPVTVTPRPGDLLGTAVAASGKQATVLWSERDGGDWQLKARTYTGEVAGAVEVVTPSAGSHIFHAAAADRAGNVHVAYQAWRKGRSEIRLRTRTAAGEWKSEIPLSDPARPERANDWYPALAVDHVGTVWVAWDGYGEGSYNVYLRAVRHGRPGELLRVTTGSRFHAHASVAVDDRDRVWLGYEEGPENWGKDLGFQLIGGTGLYAARTIRVAVYAAGRWLTTVRQPEDALHPGLRRFYHTPKLVADSAGRVWLLSRPRTSALLTASSLGIAGNWEVLASYYDRERWTEPLTVPDTVGRNEAPFDAAADGAGNVYLAAVTDNRLWGGVGFGNPPRNHDVVFTRLRAGAARPEPVLGTRAPEPPSPPFSEPREAEQIARVRAYPIVNGSKSYRIYRGDLHRHTDVSADGAGDGSLMDAYRYALDAAGMDYLAVTDHQSGGQEYTWWRIQKSADIFQVPGYFTGLFGTERSLGYPNGHRNLIFTRRGVPLLPITPAENKAQINSGSVVYPFLRQYGGIAISHTSATDMGTDWRDNDAELEPLVEIFQGARTSAEHEGAPLAPYARQEWRQAGGYRPAGFVWNAWAKRYKLGVEASSDHVSTHTSYACIIAEDGGREALLDAMRKRHTYAATSNIVLDFQAAGGGRRYLQGDIFTTRGIPELTATIAGTARLKQVVVVRDGRYVYTHEPQGETFELRYRDNDAAPGERYYYVRVEQQDGNVAWSSPVWVTVTE